MINSSPGSEKGALAVRLAGIVKQFGDLVANDHINLHMYCGEIHALLGENGAGKSTLMNMISGVYTPDSGEMELFGKKAHFKTPKDAILAKVGMVHQHFAQVPSCTVAQNISLTQLHTPFFGDLPALIDKVMALENRYGFNIDPMARVCDLSVGERQLVELLRLLAMDSRVLILDEPTAVLGPAQSNELFEILKKLADDDKAIILITHKLHEVESCAHRFSVLRKGKAVRSDMPMRDWNREQVVTWMVGESEKIVEATIDKLPEKKRETKRREPVLELEDAYAKNDAGLDGLCGVSLSLYPGEILAVAGVAGNGQLELAELAMGFRRQIKGRRKILSEDVTRKNIIQARSAGFGFLPEDRMKHGICADLTVSMNLNLDQVCMGLPFIPDRKALETRAQHLVDDFHVQAEGLDDPMNKLSGGNIQRGILAREFNAGKIALVISQPTRGLDIAATNSVRKAIVEKAKAGVGVLLISYDLDEVFELADRIIVMLQGRIAAMYTPPFPDRTEIGMAMAGGAK